MVENALTLKEVSIGYDGITVLSGLNLTIPRGASLALVGSNGSGKTTLVKTLAGLLPVIKGTLRSFRRYTRPSTSKDSLSRPIPSERIYPSLTEY